MAAPVWSSAGDTNPRVEAVVLVTDELDPELASLVTEVLGARLLIGIVTAGPAPLLSDHSGVRFLAGHHGAERVLPVPAAGDDQWSHALHATARSVVRELAAAGVDARIGRREDHGRFVVVQVTEPQERSDDLGALVDRARATSAHALHTLAARAALDAGIDDPRIWTDDGCVEIATVDEVDAVNAALDVLWDAGLGRHEVLVVADDGAAGRRLCRRAAGGRLDAVMVCAVDQVRHDHAGIPEIGGGRAAVVELLHEQVRRRAGGALPHVVPALGWSVAAEGLDPERQPVEDSLFVLADGVIGVSGAPVVTEARGRPWLLAAGVYDLDGPLTHLLEGPVPSRVRSRMDPARVRRTLDLRSGVLAEVAPDEGVEAVRFASLARPGLLVERIVAHPSLHPPAPLAPPDGGRLLDHGVTGGVEWARVAGTSGGITVAAATGRRDGAAGGYERFLAVLGDPDTVPEAGGAVEQANEARAAGFDQLLLEHRDRWAERWSDADVVIEGDDQLQADVRFALFHLMASVGDRDEAAVGARGLSGQGYRGHVFWDADTFVLPFLAATHPASARAMLEYRVRRLPAARRHAEAHGRAGARFPWESARTGLDVTPTTARDRAGQLVAIRTGLLEDHIVADVAWASSWYEEWTGDEEYRRSAGLELLVATARYWASRIRVEADGSAHLYGVIGPDEYHEPVDDNAFTNVMARWHLRRAAAAVEALGPAGVDPATVRTWCELADALVDGYDSDTGIYEQCANFFSLEPLLIAEVAPRRPIAADYLLGTARTRAAQVVKQPDVLMLHHLVPDEVVRGTLEPNLRFYEPRTAHGSSLSPAIHVALFARARDFDRALDALRIASRIDLDDLTGTTAAGLHVATMGGLWQAFAMGFAGLRPGGGGLRVDPLLPPAWSALEVHVRYRGSRVVVRRERAQLVVTATDPVSVEVEDRAYRVGSRGLVFDKGYDTWRLRS